MTQQVACVVRVSMRFRGKERGTIFREPKTKTLATQAVQQELFTIADLSQENQRSTRYSLFSHQVCQDLEKLSQ